MSWWGFYGRPECKHDRRRKAPETEGPGSHPRAQAGVRTGLKPLSVSRWSKEEADLSLQMSPAPLSRVFKLKVGGTGLRNISYELPMGDSRHWRWARVPQEKPSRATPEGPPPSRTPTRGPRCSRRFYSHLVADPGSTRALGS